MSGPISSSPNNISYQVHDPPLLYNVEHDPGERYPLSQDTDTNYAEIIGQIYLVYIMVFKYPIVLNVKVRCIYLSAQHFIVG